MLHVTALVECGESGNVDGIGVDASFLQPTGICSEGNTLIAIDSGNNSVRLVTSLQPLIKYLSVIQKMYKTFSIHPEIISRGSSDDLQKGIEDLSEISLFLNEMNLQAKSLLKLNTNCLQGPHGVLATKTIVSVTILIQLLHHLQDIVKCHTTLKNKVNLKSQLTLVNENLHNILQLKTETPTVLDCSRNFMKGVIETIKKQTLCGFHYFTPKQNFYEQQRFLKFEELSGTLNKKR